MHIITSHIDFSYLAGGNESLSPPNQSKKVSGNCQAILKYVAAFRRCWVFEHTACIICRWVLSALKAHVKVICQSAAVVKALHQSTAVIKNASAQNK